MNNKGNSKNDLAWETLFKKFDILQRISDHQYFGISADQIREFREPRLMAKFDHKINLPRIFIDNNLSILPTARGSYCISHFDTYKEFERMDSAIHQMSLPDHIQTLTSESITSEAISVNCALASGIFSDFVDEAELIPTVSGRMGSGRFSFTISSLIESKKLNIAVNNAQIEIDAALEGINSLLLVEAKNDISQDFIIRQLFYPYKTWTNRVTKKIRPIFLVYSNSIFSLYEYSFTDENDYNSAGLVKCKKYSIEDTKIVFEDIERVFNHIVVCNEPEIPFPQADNFSRIINLCELLLEKELSREDVTQEYAFNVRQTNYYTDAGRYLGLIDKVYVDKKVIYSLTEKGKSIIALRYKPRQLALCKSILEHAIFRTVFHECLHGGGMPTRERILHHMMHSNLYNVEGNSTYCRRASTVTSWLNWIISLWIK